MNLSAQMDVPKNAASASEERLGEVPVRADNSYPDDWSMIAKRIKNGADWKCERCKHKHEVETGYVLTVHHLDGNKANCADWNLAALCQRCHLRIQGRIKMNQQFMEEILPVSGWFRPHLEGYLKSLKTRSDT